MEKCKYCGSTDFHKAKRPPHVGLYCTECGKWQKWLKKDKLSEPIQIHYDYNPQPINKDDVPPWEE